MDIALSGMTKPLLLWINHLSTQAADHGVAHRRKHGAGRRALSEVPVGGTTLDASFPKWPGRLETCSRA
jgi:hypothetical protein